MIKDILVIHHSHTDIGYTDLQEKIIQRHVYYIRTLLQKLRTEGQRFPGFKWNCETYFCVEQFLQQSSPAEQQSFYDLVKQGQIGISANYLNFNDLVDPIVLQERIAEMRQIFAEQEIDVHSAMIADINGISLGSRDSLLENDIKFLYANVHCHHGMYPLRQNQQPFYWENAEGKKLLVWSGEHYNLGNVLGLVSTPQLNFMTQNYLSEGQNNSAAEQLKNNALKYLKECEDHDYPYSFIPVSVSGVFSDNAPPNFSIAQVIEEANQALEGRARFQMLTLDELYERVSQEKDIPVYQGDWTDWWAHGTASTPYAVKHYKEAQRIYHQCRQLEKLSGSEQDEVLAKLAQKWQRDAEDNLLLFAEHTWGHSATVSDPYEDMVDNLDIRNITYASKAYEASAYWLQQIQCRHGDNFNYYARSGKIRAINPGQQSGLQVLEFYIEAWAYGDIQLYAASDKRELPVQLSQHPRGVLVSFCDNLEPGETKEYIYEERPKEPDTINTRVAYIGSERVRDIVNDYDPISYHLVYCIENEAFHLSYRLGSDSQPGGIYSVYSKIHQTELWSANEEGADSEQPSSADIAGFFSPIYEYTPIQTDAYEERRLFGRNIRGLHAIQDVAYLKDVKVLEQGPIFHKVELVYELEGTEYCSVQIKVFQKLPRIDFNLRAAKKITDVPESLYLPLSLQVPNSKCYIDKGGVAFRPGVEQVPGTCMEYYLSERGLLYQTNEKASLVIHCLDAPMLYMGEMRHHAVRLCEGSEADNQRPVYSWVMNNIWETNFKMSLSGYGQFRYRLELLPAANGSVSAQQAFEQIWQPGNICFPIS